MKEPKKVQRVSPLWADVLLAFVSFVACGMILHVYLSWIAERHGTVFELCGITLAVTFGSCVFTVAIVGLWILLLAVYAWRYASVKHWWAHFVRLLMGLLFCITLAVFATGGVYKSVLASAGIGTMQTALDTDYHQEDLQVMGELGVYGGRLVSGDPEFYVCRQMDTFGPFERQVLEDTATQNFSTGYEQYTYLEQDNLLQLRALSVQHYDDGYWLVVKRFVAASDLGIKIESLSDLERYIVQMQYNCDHSGGEEKLLREYADLVGDAVMRVQ